MAEFETPGRVSLHVQNPEGSIEIVVHDDPRTTVELLPLSDNAERLIEAARIEAQQRGDEHVVRVELPSKGRLSFRSSGVAVRVQVPGGASINVNAASADTSVRGTVASADVRTASGDVRLGDVDGDATLRSASGDIEAGRIGGNGRIETASGDVEVAHAVGELAARSVSGDMTIQAADGSVQANSVSGDVRLEAVQRGQVKVQSVSGDVVVAVREGVRLWVDAQSLSGDMDSELPVSDGPVGDGEAELELRVKTVSGDLHLTRARG
jgi:DUF4097 and DUF4098 domain-containing protein YvlB